MSFASIPGQEQAKRILQNALRRNKLSHAYIFSGPRGSGRSLAAAKLAQAVFCLQNRDDPCGQCLECRKIEHGNHPDLRWIDPDGATIKIEQIRDLQKQFSFRSAEARKKIYVIREAERMTPQAANSLLKFLEEPQSDVTAVLITDNGQALLPTIRSRAQLVPFTRVPAAAMEKVFLEQGFPIENVRPAVRLAAGPEAALELLEAPWFAQARDAVLQLGLEALTRLPSALITLQEKLVHSDLSERIPVLLDLFLLWLKDMILLRHGRKTDVVYIDQVDQMSKHALSRDDGFWVACMERVVELQKRSRFHANPQMLLEKLLIDIQGG